MTDPQNRTPLAELENAAIVQIADALRLASAVRGRDHLLIDESQTLARIALGAALDAIKRIDGELLIPVKAGTVRNGEPYCVVEHKKVESGYSAQEYESPGYKVAGNPMTGPSVTVYVNVLEQT